MEELDITSNPEYQAFIESFEELLHKQDAVELLGLCKYPGDDFRGPVEISEWRANMNPLLDEYPRGMKARGVAKSQ
ncbi:hypothetical protein QQS21_012831, partial [Conoideocrella luteorostrata]